MGKISSKNLYVDESAVSVVAYLVILIIVFGIHFQQQWLLLFLAFDFLLRATGFFPSPLYFVAKKISAFLNFEKKAVFAGPKRFAAMLGFFMTALISIFYDNQVGIYLGLSLIILAALESILNICVGFYIYNFLVLPIQNKFNNSSK